VAIPSTAKSRRFSLLTYGSRGDVEPFVALGVGLSRAGHSVRLAAPAPFRGLAEAYGLGFSALPGDPDRLALALADRAGMSWPRMIARMIEYVQPLAGDVLRSTLEATDQAEVIIHSFLMTEAGHTIARSRGLPDISAQLFPVFVTTSEFPALVFPDLPLGNLYRRATHVLNTGIFRRGGRLLYRRLRAKTAGLPELAPWPFGEPSFASTPILFAYSPSFLPAPRDWPAYVSVTGYWNLPPPDGWSPPDSLLRFLEAGPTPIFIGVGSMRTRRLKDLLEVAADAVRETGQRAVLGFPQALLEGLGESDRFYGGEGIPHAWLFPRMRFVLHHGGAGTTGAALRAGVPSTAAPFSADQAFWARRILRLGLGPPAPPALRLTPRRLKAIIDRALTEPSFASRAYQMSELVRREDGVAFALRCIEEYLDGGRANS
jgi:sterol 3beta-glucosyltransferase